MGSTHGIHGGVPHGVEGGHGGEGRLVRGLITGPTFTLAALAGTRGGEGHLIRGRIPGPAALHPRRASLQQSARHTHLAPKVLAARATQSWMIEQRMRNAHLREAVTSINRGTVG